MKKQMKYFLMGIVIGIIIGITVFYLLVTFRFIRPFMPFGFDGNFSRSFPRSPPP